MGYGHYVLADGREAGYAVEATCDQDGCDAEIDRGHLCGRTPGGGEYGCGGYFCGQHLWLPLEPGDPKDSGYLCRACLDGIRQVSS